MVDSLLEIIIGTGWKSEVLQAYGGLLCDKCYWRDWGKHGFSYG